MFVQVIRGRAKDAAGVKKQSERWEQELMPGAKGFLGSTSGVADDGQFVAVVRFESEQAAKANSERPEQGKWWSETQKYLEDVTFRNSAEIDLWGGGGSDDAGFVQIIEGRARDKGRLREINSTLESELSTERPEVIGGTVIWDGDAFTEVAYFTSEAEAREGEKKMPSGGAKEAFEEYTSLMESPSYVDLRDPWLR